MWAEGHGETLKKPIGFHRLQCRKHAFLKIEVLCSETQKLYLDWS